MTVTNLLSGAVAGASNVLHVGGIGSGLYAPVQLNQTGNVTALSFVYMRNGSIVYTAKMNPYDGAIIDLSAFSAANLTFPAYARNLLTAMLVDAINVSYTESGVARLIYMKVANIACANIVWGQQGNYGSLSDYKDGYFNQLDFAITKTTYLSGVPFNNRWFYLVYNVSDAAKFRYLSGGAISNALNGTMWNSPTMQDMELFTIDGISVIGQCKFRFQQPYCSDPMKRITLRWLNSKGMYDTMFCYSYRIQPVYQVTARSGNRITSYDVTVNIVIDDNNERAMYWLSRSPDVYGVFPVDTNQWAKVTIQNPSAFQTQGGIMGRTVSYKCKFEIVEQ